MGVITTLYSVEPKRMKKLRADNENIAFVTGDCENESEKWQMESYDFDTEIETFIGFFYDLGFDKTRKSINSEYADLDVFDYNGYDIWEIPPSGIKAMVKELESATFEELKAKIIENEIQLRDRRGTLIPNNPYELYLKNDVENIKNFLKRALEQGHYLLFVEA